MALIEAILADDKFGMDIQDADGHMMRMDIPVDQGGSGSGFRPMQSMLAALCGCSSVDVISILKKQRQEVSSLKIEVDGHREEGKEPSLWKQIHLVFKMEGSIDLSKAKRAVDLSLEKYCSVAETLRKAGATIDYSIYLNGSRIE
jgi:putative redox protein